MADAKKNPPWNSRENQLIVAHYFKMLEFELAGEPYNKREQNRALQQLIGRGGGSIEYKHQNISAVLHRLGLPFIKGYKPAVNYQASLVNAVADHLSSQQADPVWTEDDAITKPRMLEFDAGPPSFVERANESTRAMQSLIRNVDPAERDARNRELGKQGEQLAFDAECRRLVSSGRQDLASRVCWVSQELGDGAGFDIRSFDLEGNERLLEVKTTRGDAKTPFHLSANERRVSEERAKNYHLLRVYDFTRSPRAFELRPPLERVVALKPTNYLATFW